MNELSLLSSIIVVAPLTSALICGLCGQYIGKKATHYLATFLVGLSFCISAYMFYAFNTGKYLASDFKIYNWVQAGILDISFGYLLDKLSILMITTVNFISLMVHIYTIGYMRDDPGYQRFFCYISFFTFGMLILVMANNLVQLFFGWEIVGLMSYLLIGFWYKKPSAIFANLKAFIINRIGDIGFVIAMAAILNQFGSLNFSTVFASLSGSLEPHAMTNLIAICLFIAAMAKSAQIPLHVWLPDSMEGPTPISALIHAATMVTAGVYLVARMSPIFECSDVVRNIIVIVGLQPVYLSVSWLLSNRILSA